MRNRARSFFVSVVFLCLWALACTSPQKRSGKPWLGDTHAGPGESRTAVEGRPLWRTQAEAEAALAQALERGANEDAVRAAGAVTALGGTLDGATIQRLLASIDALPGEVLSTFYEGLDPAVFPAPHLALRLSLLAWHRGDLEGTAAWLGRATSQEGSFDSTPEGARLKAKARDLAAWVDARQRVAADTLAVLLPRSGQFAALGAELEAVIRLAGQASGGRIKLLLLDTAGDGTRAAQAVDEAFFRHRALAVLGPVGQRESQAAAARAAELGIPIALLAPGDGHPGALRAGVFRLWSSPTREAAQAAEAAVAMGYDRLAVLAPRDEHGSAMARAFAEAAKRAGAAVVASGDYDPTGSALEPDMRRFLGLDPVTNERLRRHLKQHGRKEGWKTFSPDVAFDLLYIPDDYQRAALVVAYLPYFNVEVRSRDIMDAVALRRKHRGRVPQVVQLLGSSGWHHEGMITRGGSAVEGALVVDVFAGGEQEEYVTEEGARFAEALLAATGRPPTALGAQAYDAARLAALALEQAAQRARSSRAPVAGDDLRAAFVRALSGIELDDGACGPARVGADGAIVREVSVLRIDGGQFVPHEY